MWAASEKGRLIRGNTMPLLRDSNEAETYAIMAAVAACFECWPEPLRLLVRTDCQEAIRRLTSPDPSSQFGREVEALRATLDQHGSSMVFRWVKGHNGRDTRPSYVNSEVDRIARANMKKVREELR